MEDPGLSNREALTTLLEEAKNLGFLGPGPVEAQLERALAFRVVLGPRPPRFAVDLGTGGGLPGLVLASTWPKSTWVLVEVNGRRSSWLASALKRLALEERVEVVNERAESLARRSFVHEADLVTARSFAAPGPTAECGAPFLAVGGLLAVADPPENTGPPDDRWPAAGLALLGLRFVNRSVVSTPGGPVTIALMESFAECPGTYPRRVGIPQKRPIF